MWLWLQLKDARGRQWGGRELGKKNRNGIWWEGKVLFRCHPTWRNLARLATGTQRDKNLKAPAKPRKRETAANYSSLSELLKESIPKKTCIFIAGDSGIDMLLTIIQKEMVRRADGKLLTQQIDDHQTGKDTRSNRHIQGTQQELRKSNLSKAASLFLMTLF